MGNYRLDYAKKILELYNIEYNVVNETYGHIHCRRKSDDNLFQFYANTGKIVGSDKKGIYNLIYMLDDVKDISKNEMIISNYDCRYKCSVVINGEKQCNNYDIVKEYSFTDTNDITKFMEKYNIHRLIVCEDGFIEIYVR